jgi:hypothetical protein
MHTPMKKDITICFEINPEISNALEKIAVEEKQSVSSVVESIISHHLKDNKSKVIFQSRRRSERKKVGLPAFVGDPRWQRREFKEGTIIDISFGGIRFSVPKGTKLEVKNDGETEWLNVIFTLPDFLWPINVKCHPRRVSESEEEVHIGAALVNPDFNTYLALQKYLI